MEKNIPVSQFLVTGGAGFIGSNICETLLGLGHRVRCLDNLSTGRIENVKPFMSHPSFEFVEGDICNIVHVKEVCIGVDYVIHQAAWGSVPRSVEQPVEYVQNNIYGTVCLMNAARLAGVRGFVYASSAAVYGDDLAECKVEDTLGSSLSPYALTKLSNEEFAQLYAKLYGFPAVGLRYFNVFGKNQDPNGAYASVLPKFVKEILDGGTVTIYGDGLQTRDFVHVDNVVKANILAAVGGAAYPGQVYNVACGTSVTLLEMYNQVCRALGAGGKPCFEPPRVGDIKFSAASIEKIQKDLGYVPEIDFEKGLDLTIEWYKENIKSF